MILKGKVYVLWFIEKFHNHRQLEEREFFLSDRVTKDSLYW